VRDDRARLLDILEAIGYIEKYAEEGRERFVSDELVQTWVMHHLLIIGEAARALSPELQAEHPEIPWHKIIGMRNTIAHHYFGIDIEVVWAVVEKELPELKNSMNKILKKF
jgi:uncharacterized protein with HEPN domain